jgi:hypothetical protein
MKKIFLKIEIIEKHTCFSRQESEFDPRTDCAIVLYVN